MFGRRELQILVGSKTNFLIGIHLLLGTRRFGVNGTVWSDFDSMFHTPWYKKPKYIVKLITAGKPWIRWRMKTAGWIYHEKRPHEEPQV